MALRRLVAGLSPKGPRGLLCFLCVFSCFSAAQTRPLRTAEAEVVPPGTLRVQVGFDFLQDMDFPLSGLSGDLTSVAVLGVRMGVGKIVELQLEGAVQHFLDIRRQATSFVPLSLTAPNSTHDTGDFSLTTKVRVLKEKRRRPAVAIRAGFQMPNSDQARGIGTNTTNVLTDLILQKHLGKFNLFGNAGLGILQAPNARFSQKDVLRYGGAFIYALHHRVNIVGEIAGHHSTPEIGTGLIGTESRSQARLGLRIFAGGFEWDLAGIAGVTQRDARTGFTFGISKDFHVFDYGQVP